METGNLLLLLHGLDRPVGNLLLSERDGNINAWNISSTNNIYSRKPTTLWKRWKRAVDSYNYPWWWYNVGNLLLSERDGNATSLGFIISAVCSPSETYYSLKEMETLYFLSSRSAFITLVGNPLLSERDGNKLLLLYRLHKTHKCRKPTTLWKRWKQRSSKPVHGKFVILVGNPLLSERDGNFLCTHSWRRGYRIVGNLLLSERDGNVVTMKCSLLTNTS